MKNLEFLYEGRSRVAKRWLIAVSAIAGIVQTFPHVPEWAKELAIIAAGVI